MKLLFDIGNSSTHWALVQDDVFVTDNRFDHQPNKFSVLIEDGLLVEHQEQISHVLVANVAGKNVLKELQDWCKKKLPEADFWEATVTTSLDELKNSYADISQMGIDRWLAMIAAWEKYHACLCVVDCGTAVTIDLVDASGEHIGGYILPGLAMMQQSLSMNTIQIDTSVKKQVLISPANNTRDAVSHGASLAISSAINHAVDEIVRALYKEPHCIITGGMAESFQSQFQQPFSYMPNLVLEGLSILHRKTQ